MRKLEHINSGCVDCVFETMASGEEVRIAEFYGPDSGELATLTAAAPELLEACKEVMRIHDCNLSAANRGWDDAERIWAKVNAAIAKAEGKRP